MKHPIGFNVRQDNVNYPDVLAQVKRMGGVRCMLFHVDISTLHRLLDFTPYCDLIIWRPREWTSETLYSQFPIRQFSSGATTNGAMNFIDMCIQALEVNALPLAKVAIHLHNEAGIGPQVIQWDTMAAQRAVEQGARVVGLNTSVGTPDNIQDAELYLRYAAANPDAVLVGIHDGYFSVYGHRKERWYLRRWERYWEDWRKAQGIGPVQYVITEGGAEDIADDHPYTDTLPRTSGYNHIGGVHTLDAAWAATYGSPEHNLKPKQYPGKDRAYLEQLKIAYDIGNHGDGRVIGWCLYSWGGGGRWTAYDVSHMGKFLEDLAETEFVSEPIPYPIPIDPYREIVAELRNMGDSKTLSLRKSPSLQAPILARIEAGKPMGYIWPAVEGDNVQGAGNQWLRVKYNGIEGYAHAHYLVVPELETPEPPAPEPEPPAPPVPDDLEHKRMKAEALQKMRDGLQEVTRGLDKAAQGLQALLLMIESEIEELEEAA